MSLRLSPVVDGDYDCRQLRNRLREAKVTAGIKVSIGRVEETAAVAKRIGVDPTPLRNALGIPEDEAEGLTGIPRRTLSKEDIEQLKEFCAELLEELESVIDFWEIKEKYRDLEEGEPLMDHIDSETYECYRTSRYVRTIEPLCEKALEWYFQLKIG